MTRNPKTNKQRALERRIKNLQDKQKKYFMENRVGEFRMRVINTDTKREKKIRPTNVEEFTDDDLPNSI
jgi:hypothetical protein